jgi:hypothetical protein
MLMIWLRQSLQDLSWFFVVRCVGPNACSSEWNVVRGGDNCFLFMKEDSKWMSLFWNLGFGDCQFSRNSLRFVFRFVPMKIGRKWRENEEKVRGVKTKWYHLLRFPNMTWYFANINQSISVGNNSTSLQHTAVYLDRY